LLEFEENLYCSSVLLKLDEDSDCVLKLLDEVDGGEFVLDFVSRNLNEESSDVGVVNENEKGDFGFVSPPPSSKFSDDLDLRLG
jgi:hypothetical protein